MKDASPYLLGIAGGSASGKTTLARALVERAGADHAVIISLDSYYRCLSHLPEAARAEANFDHPDAFEYDLLASHLEQLKAQEAIETPTYCYVTHTRLPQRCKLSANMLIIVEGIFTLYWQELRDQFSQTIFVEASPEERLARRITRDTKERGRTLESVESQWATTVEPMYQQFCHPTKEHADETVNGEVTFEEIAEAILSGVLGDR
jgi:uridine kinase